jgi:hypothetical protein
MAELSEVLHQHYPNLTARQLETLSATLQVAMTRVADELSNTIFIPKVTITAHIDTPLGDTLTSLRTNAKLTQKEAAQRLDWSVSKVIRVETNLVSISGTDLRALLQLYEVSNSSVIQKLVDEAARISRIQRSRRKA